MKTNKFIIWSIISIALTSCFSENYRIITQINRDGSCRREIHFKADSISEQFPYDISLGWKISEKDTIVKEYLSEKIRKNFIISKKFNSVEELSADLQHDRVFPTPKESLKKRFRWFYTCYAFTAVYPETTDKGRVPMDKYISKARQKFYLQGDLSDYRGMNGYELKLELDDIETAFMKWYARSIYEECFDIILHHADDDDRSQLSAVKDTLYSLHERKMGEEPKFNDVCTALDLYFATDRFSILYAGNANEMDNIFEERLKVINRLMEFNIRYELMLPGKIMTANTDLQNDGVLVWNVNLFRFLTDDYTLTAESRVANIWAFAVTLLLIVFSVYCLIRYFR